MRIQGAVTLLRGALRAAGSTAPSGAHAAPAASLVLTRGFADDADLKRTPLYEYHLSQGGEQLLA